MTEKYLILKFIPYVQSIDELQTIFNSVDAILPEDTGLIMIPNNMELILNEDLSYLKQLRQQLDKIINDKGPK